jgi:hypothetical protein
LPRRTQWLAARHDQLTNAALVASFIRDEDVNPKIDMTELTSFTKVNRVAAAKILSSGGESFVAAP